MARCSVCEIEYDKSLEISYGGDFYTFCCFECAIHKLSPACGHCGCRVIGHGTEVRGTIYCCEKCAEHGAVVKAHHSE